MSPAVARPGKGVRIARSTKRPAKRAQNGVGRARKVVARFTPEQLSAELGLTQDQVDVLDRIASGRPPRNAAAIIAGIKLKLDFTQPKPTQNVNVKGTLTLEQLVTGETDARSGTER